MEEEEETEGQGGDQTGQRGSKDCRREANLLLKSRLRTTGRGSGQISSKWGAQMLKSAVLKAEEEEGIEGEKRVDDLRTGQI
jgi:hypothetical protein